MDTDRIGGRRLKKRVFEILSGDNFNERLPEIRKFPGRQVVNHLFSCLYNTDDLIKWRAVTAMGETVSSIADADIESARVVMRRLMWNLNDESGGIGWGSPEAMGEIIARNKRLGDEYARILISYININGNYLENEILLQGVIWGIGRIASLRPELVRDSIPFLIPFISSRDTMLRGLAAWTICAIDPVKAESILSSLNNDDSKLKIFAEGKLTEFSIKDIITGTGLYGYRVSYPCP
ncbi:MAG: HEAT repeat domain-containing protein [Desulfobacterales bacterium]